MTTPEKIHEVSSNIRKNKWTLGYVAAITTAGFVAQIYYGMKGH